MRTDDPDIIAAIESGQVETADLLTLNLGCSKSQYLDESTCELNGGVWTGDVHLTSYGRDLTRSLSQDSNLVAEVSLTNSNFLTSLNGWSFTNVSWARYYGVPYKFAFGQTLDGGSEAPLPGDPYYTYLVGTDAWTKLGPGSGGFYSSTNVPPFGQCDVSKGPPGYVVGELDVRFHSYPMINPTTGLAYIGPWESTAELSQLGVLTIGETYKVTVDCKFLGSAGELALNSAASPVPIKRDQGAEVVFVADQVDLSFSYTNPSAVDGDLRTAAGLAVHGISLQLLDDYSTSETITYESTNEILELPVIPETLDMEMGTVDIPLISNSRTWITDAQAREILYRKLTIWKAFINVSTGQIISDPMLVYAGVIVGGGISADNQGAGAVVTLKVSNQFYIFDKVSGFQCNTDSHQQFFPGDTGFKNTSESQTHLKWP